MENNSFGPHLTLDLSKCNKNKLSDYKGIQNLEFTRATGTMKEVPAFLSVPPTSGQTFNDGGSLD